MSHKCPADLDVREKLARIEALLQQREREILELNHRISNSLQLASSLMTIQRNRLDNNEAKQALDSAISRLAAVGQLHRHLNERRTAQQVDFGQFLEELVPDITASTGLECRIEVERVDLSSEKALHLAVAVNELVMNAGKHGYSGGANGGTVTITCCENGSGRLELSVADAGNGLPDGFSADQAHGLGLNIVRSTAHQFGGDLRIENQDGTRFTIEIPLP